MVIEARIADLGKVREGACFEKRYMLHHEKTTPFCEFTFAVYNFKGLKSTGVFHRKRGQSSEFCAEMGKDEKTISQMEGNTGGNRDAGERNSGKILCKK